MSAYLAAAINGVWRLAAKIQKSKALLVAANQRVINANLYRHLAAGVKRRSGSQLA
jgi:hypothetical protein